MPDQSTPPTFGRLLLEELRNDPELLREVRELVDSVRAPERLLTTNEAAKILGLHPGTLTQMARDGRISGAQRPGGSTRWRFVPSELAVQPVPGRCIPASPTARPRPRTTGASPGARAILGGEDRRAA
jgi:excisionase family DNA binding protein